MPLSLQLGLIYLTSELLLTATRRSRSRTGTKQDRSTLGVLWLVIMASVAAGVYGAEHLPAAALPHVRFFALAGVALFFYTMWGRIRPVGSQLREAKGEKF